MRASVCTSVVLLAVLLLCSCARQAPEFADLVHVDGVFREKGSDAPFTGEVLYTWNGVVRCRARICDGTLHGRFETFFTNGEHQVVAEFDQGDPVGPATLYSLDGRVIWSMNYTDGLLEGPLAIWWVSEPDVLRLEGQCVRGTPVGTWVQYLPDGARESVVTLKDGRLVGDMLAWHPGDRPKVRGSVDSTGQGRYSLFGSDGRCYETGSIVEWEVVDVVGESRAPTQSLSRFRSFVDGTVELLRDPVPHDIRALARPPN